MILVDKQTSDIFKSVVEYTNQVFNFSLVLNSLSQKIGLSWTVGDILGNGRGLSEFEVSINKIRQIGEVKSKT